MNDPSSDGLSRFTITQPCAARERDYSLTVEFMPHYGWFCTANFSLLAHLPLVDAIDALPHLQVVEVKTSPRGNSFMHLDARESDEPLPTESMVDAIERLMKQYLTPKQSKI